MILPSSAGTQAALLTPLGPAGITVIQILGPDATSLAERISRDAKGRQINLTSKPDRIYHCYIVEPNGQPVDEVVICTNQLSPHGSQTVDICCHGGVRPGQKIMELLTGAGAQAVEAQELPGAGLAEFVDLAGGNPNGLAGEVLGQLCRATADLSVRILLEQLHGGLTAQLQRLLSKELEIEECRVAIDRLLDSWRWGRRLTEPAKIAVIGAVNAGKSSLANLLSGETGSIVTSQAGTTLDWVTHQISLAGLEVVLIDTAGHRAATDALEIEAIRRATQQSSRADVQLLVIDGTNPKQAVPEPCSGTPTLIALNKADLKDFSNAPLPSELAHWPCVKTSALTGQGRQELTTALLKALNCQKLHDGGAVVFTERQKKCLESAASALNENDHSPARNALRECLTGRS